MNTNSNNGLKLQDYTFDYYLLELDPNVDFSLIQQKLSALARLDINTRMIVSFTKLANEDELSKLIKLIKQLSFSLGLNLWALDKQFLPKNITTLDNIPILDISQYKLNKKKPQPIKSLIIDEPIRSGISIKHPGDIIINSFVSNSAEIIANGNIHIYGEARGRIIAGASGDFTCRIFIGKFNSELISIGGIYRNLEENLPDGVHLSSVMISLNEHKRLVISPLTI